ncbi:MAG: Zn-dependent protease with chaperone function, partial [Ilumatobacteraceae bacterium]|nr:Zn-dependent protease with chaperone function [Ilumatobacteraceae bacterium]
MYQQIARNKRLAVIYVVLFFVIWVGIGAAAGWIVASMAAPGVSATPVARDIATGAVVAGLLAVAGIAFSLRSGARLVLSASGARPADPVEYARLHNLVEGLAIAAGLPKPDVYVIDDPSPNAFATGVSPQHAAITATTGLLAIMNRDELEGVLSHELSHIKNYDVRLLLIVSTLIGMAGLLASLVFRSMLMSRGGRGRRNDQTAIVLVAVGVLFGAVALVFGPLVRLALSRRREELADVSGVALSRNPAGLISALHKLESNDEPFAHFNHATAAMCIDDPLQHHGSWLHHLFDTHPPLAERIAVLERIYHG